MIRLAHKGLVIPLFIAMLLASPAAAQTFAQLKGSWSCSEEGFNYTLEFKTESTLIYNGQQTQYQVNENTLLVQEEYGLVPYPFQLQDDTLTILSMDGTVSQCRKGASPPTPGSHAALSPQATGSAVAGQVLVPGQNWPVYARPSGNIGWDSADPQALLYKFAGRWDNYSGSTLSNLYLKPDGSYEDASETSYSGSFQDAGGYQTGAWGAVGQQQAQGHWTIQGTLARGTITLVKPGGGQTRINYQVHVKNGEYYGGEYFFNGNLYSVNYVYR